MRVCPLEQHNAFTVFSLFEAVITRTHCSGTTNMLINSQAPFTPQTELKLKVNADRIYF